MCPRIGHRISDHFGLRPIANPLVNQSQLVRNHTVALAAFSCLSEQHSTSAIDLTYRAIGAKSWTP